MIEAKKLTYMYPVHMNLFKKKYKIAVNNLNLKIPQGKIVGLLGDNGAGKTTTIRMLSSLIKPTKGQIYIDGLAYVDEIDSSKIKQKVNVISGGERGLYWKLTAKENLKYIGSLYNISSKTISSKIDEVLDIVGLRDSKDSVVENFSKGMKQRLQIASGLLTDPKYLLLDEPTLGLDVVIASELRSYIRNLALNFNKGILLTTHYLREAEELCDYILLLKDGKIVLQGNPEQLKNSFANKNIIEIRLNSKAEKSEISELKKRFKSVKLDEKTMITISQEKISIYSVSKYLESSPLNKKVLSIHTSIPTLEDLVMLYLKKEDAQN